MYGSNKKDYYKPIRTGNVFSSNYIEYESNGDKNKSLPIEEYLDKIRSYLSDIINDHKTQGEWKILHTNSDNIGILIGNETDDIIDELYNSLLQRYKKSLEESMKGSEFIFDIADLLHYKSHGISLNRGGSYIDFPEWLKNKKETIIPKTNDDRCIQYAVSVALNHQSIKNNTERIGKD